MAQAALPIVPRSPQPLPRAWRRSRTGIDGGLARATRNPECDRAARIPPPPHPGERRLMTGRASGDCASTRQAGRRPRVLHISADFPDPVDGNKTRAVHRLLDLTAPDFHHEVISLNRVNPRPVAFLRGTIARRGRPPRAIVRGEFSYGQWWTYEAPPRGLFLRSCLADVADEICQTLSGRALPDLVVGHKLTVEGLVARQVAGRLSLPFATGIMGDTDLKIARSRPDLADEFSKVLHDAAAVYSLAPWSLARLEGMWGARSGPSAVIPCATDADQVIPPRALGEGFVSLFHLKNAKRKNLPGMLRAYRKVRERGVATSLTIMGGGDDAEVQACERAANGLSGVRFTGPIDRADIGQRLNRATGFVLPSLRESFGMVFVEALFAGIPIIYPKGAAVDGFFDGLPFARPVDARDEDAIADAMCTFVAHEEPIKAALASWQVSPEARRFTRKAIGDDFAAWLDTGIVA